MNVNLMEENIIQSKNGITAHNNVTVKSQENIVYTKKIMLEILVQVLVRLINT